MNQSIQPHNLAVEYTQLKNRGKGRLENMLYQFLLYVKYCPCLELTDKMEGISRSFTVDWKIIKVLR